LQNYFKIIEGKINPNYLTSKNQKIPFKITESTDKLWFKHNNLKSNLICFKNRNETSLLDLKIELIRRILNNCTLCENKCKIDREINRGICGVKNSRIASEFIHYGEEKNLVPSYTIFFSGCTFKCQYCQNWDISQYSTGINIHSENLLEKIKFNLKFGIKNINWVGGEPTPNLKYILKFLSICNINLPQIWNSNMYCSEETMKILNKIFDLYLTDFKYGNNKCAVKYSKINNYFDIITRNHKLAYQNGEMIIRHLVIPNHIECCSKPILDWISKNLENVIVNIMDQYHPYFKAYKYDEINRKIKLDEFKQIMKYANDLNINII
jgi:putative pyruvate formate lyase activating enzyme